jgi:hypothetical protein
MPLNPLEIQQSLKYWPAPGKIIFVQDVVIFGNVWMMNASKIG